MIQPDKLRQLIDAHATDAERQAITLVYGDGLGYRRAGEVLGISPRAVRDRIDNLRRKLAKEGHDL